jgi:hypothetical protein
VTPTKPGNGNGNGLWGKVMAPLIVAGCLAAVGLAWSVHGRVTCNETRITRMEEDVRTIKADVKTLLARTPQK